MGIKIPQKSISEKDSQHGSRTSKMSIIRMKNQYIKLNINELAFQFLTPNF